jgi:hypothetical protein
MHARSPGHRRPGLWPPTPMSSSDADSRNCWTSRSAPSSAIQRGSQSAESWSAVQGSCARASVDSRHRRCCRGGHPARLVSRRRGRRHTAVRRPRADHRVGRGHLRRLPVLVVRRQRGRRAGPRLVGRHPQLRHRSPARDRSAYGPVVASGDINGDSYDDLVTGEPHSPDDGGASTTGGMVGVYYGSPDGPVGQAGPRTPPLWWTQDTKGVPGVTERGDGFGTDLSVGDTNGDRYARRSQKNELVRRLWRYLPAVVGGGTDTGRRR